MNTINFTEAFTAAEATNNYDKLFVVLTMTAKAVKEERDRLIKDDVAHAKFAKAVETVTDLNDAMRSDPGLIDDYYAAAKAMQAAHNGHLARGEKSIPQWNTINECFDEAVAFMNEITPENNTLAEAA